MITIQINKDMMTKQKNKDMMSIQENKGMITIQTVTINNLINNIQIHTPIIIVFRRLKHVRLLEPMQIVFKELVHNLQIMNMIVTEYKEIVRMIVTEYKEIVRMIGTDRNILTRIVERKGTEPLQKIHTIDITQINITVPIKIRKDKTDRVIIDMIEVYPEIDIDHRREVELLNEDDNQTQVTIKADL